MTFVSKWERDVVGGGGGDAVHDGGEGARHGEGVGAVDKKSECRSIDPFSIRPLRSEFQSVGFVGPVLCQCRPPSHCVPTLWDDVNMTFALRVTLKWINGREAALI